MITESKAWENLAFIQSYEHNKYRKKEIIDKIKEIQFYIERSKDYKFIKKIDDFLYML